MIKKLFLCAALVGAVGLTSCVDDVESASVTEIRNAKAEQLKAAAALDKANADAAIIMANAQQKIAETGAAAQQAEAERLKAEAAYLNAQAALEQAKADAQKAQTEIDKQKAEVAIQQALANVEYTKALTAQQEAEVARLQAELEAQIAEYEQRIAKANFEAEEYKLKLENLIKDQAGTDYNRIVGLLTQYKGASSDLVKLQSYLKTAQFNLVKLQAGLESSEQAIATAIETQQTAIETANGNIEAAKKALAIYETADVQDAMAKLPALQEQQAALKPEKRNALLEVEPAMNALVAASKAVANSAYWKAAKALANSGSTHYPTGVKVEKINDDKAPVAAQGQYCVVVTTWDASYTNKVVEYYPILTYSDAVPASFEYKNINSQSATANYNEYPTIPSLDAAGAKKLNDLMAANVAADKKDSEAKAKKLTDETKLQTALVKALEDYRVAKNNNTNLPENTPNEALIKAQKDAAEALVKAINAIMGTEAKVGDHGFEYGADFNAWTKLTQSQLMNGNSKYAEALREIDSRVNTATTAANQAANSLVEAEANQKEVAGWLDTLSDATAFNKLLDTYTAALKEAKSAKDKYDAIVAEETSVSNLIAAYNNVIVNGKNPAAIQKDIKEQEDKIATNEAAIKEAEAQLAELEKINETTDKYAIAYYEAEIESLKARIEAQQKVVDAAKAALDAAIEAAQPATPAE